MLKEVAITVVDERVLKDERDRQQGEDGVIASSATSRSGGSRPLKGDARNDFDSGHDIGQNLVVRNDSKRVEFMPSQGANTGTNRREAVDVTPQRAISFERLNRN